MKAARMAILKQLLLALAVVAAAIALWIAFVPEARPLLARLGVYDVLGLPPPAEAASPGARPAQGGGRGAGPAGARGAVAVVAQPVGQAAMNDNARAIGDGRALRSVVVRPQVSGQITAVNITSGAHVDAGAVLAELEDEAQKIALDKARLQLSDARETLERQEKLGTSGATAVSRIQEAQLALRTAELAVRQAEFDLSQRRILAPIAGWIGLNSAQVGEQVTTASEIAEIDDRSSLLIDFRLPERYVGQLRPGLAVAATPLARTDVALSGRIKAIDNRVDEASRSILVQAELANPGDRLRAGMAFAITIDLPGEKVPAVPPLSVQWSGEGAFVWAVKDGKARRVALRILQRNADAVLVKADLQPGEPVVTEGVQMLRPGAEVTMQAGDPGLAAGEGAGAPKVAKPMVSQ